MNVVGDIVTCFLVNVYSRKLVRLFRIKLSTFMLFNESVNLILCSIHIKESSNLSDEPARVRTGENLGDFGGSGRDKISFVYIERAHPFREEVRMNKFDEPSKSFFWLTRQTVHIRIPTQET